MQRRGVAWLLAGAALLACPGAAGGSIPAALETFSGAWPTGCSEVAIEQGSDPDPTVSGFATPGTCVIYVTPTFLAKKPSARRVCAVVVHEYGHLLGLGHSSDERNVMFPRPMPPPACASEDTTPAAGAVTAAPMNVGAARVTVRGYQQPTTTGNDRPRRSGACARRSLSSAAKARIATARSRRARGSRRSCRR